MYIPYAAVYFVDRIYISCRLSSACAELSIANYMTEELIIMGVGCILHLPIWTLGLRILDIRKGGGKVRDAFRINKVRQLWHFQTFSDFLFSALETRARGNVSG